MPKDLLVPGTSGNKLLLDNADLGWPSALLAQGWLAGKTGFALALDGLPMSAKQIVDVMSMEFADATSIEPTRTTLKAGSAIAPGPMLELVYNQFLKFDRFLYDFRADVRQSGQHLLNHLIENRPNGDRWRLVAHSQGGLLVVIEPSFMRARTAMTTARSRGWSATSVLSRRPSTARSAPRRGSSPPTS